MFFLIHFILKLLYSVFLLLSKFDIKYYICIINLTVRGIYVVSFHHPLVPKTKARVVVQISAMHSEDDIDRALRTFQEVGRELQVI